MEEPKNNKYHDRLKQLENGRTEWESQWKEISEYILPRRGKFDERQANKGEKRHSKIIDGRPTKSILNLAGMLQGGLTSPSRPWFRLGLPDPDLMEWGPAKEWLKAVERIMYQAFSRSNFYGAVASVYVELIGFGTGCNYMEEDFNNYLCCQVQTAGVYFLAVDDRGRVDALYRKFPMTARQMIQRWGETACSNDVVQAVKHTPFQYFDVVQAVEPRKKREVKKLDARNKPYASVYFEYGCDDKVLSESGYDEFPFQAPRWDVSGADVYGRGPGMDALPDVKMLQDITKGLIMGVHKELDPPLQIPSELKHRLSLLPGALNYTGRENKVETIYHVKPSLREASELREQVMEAVREHFFNDLFVYLMNRANVTATEVAERHEEKLLLLGPVIERQEAEFLNPIIERAFGILGRAGMLPPPPEEIQQQDMKIEYISLLAQAQKQVGTHAVEKVLSFAGQAASFDPTVLDKIDFDQAVDVYSDLVGVPSRIVRSDDQVAKLRAQRAQQAQAQQHAREMAGMIGAAKELGSIKTDEPNALTELLGGTEQGRV